jgi:DNA-binding transcriptional LysR family regulator
VYAQREKASRFRRAAFDRQPWIALDDSAAGSNGLRLLGQLLPLEQVTLRFSGLMMVRAACAQGLGLALLPCFLGDVEPDLVRMGEPVPECDSELWLLSHPDLRETTRIKAMRQWLLHALSARVKLLAGLAPP